MQRSLPWVLLKFLFLFATPIVHGADIQLRPVHATGNYTINGQEIILRSAGQSVFLELFVSGWDPDRDGIPRLRAVEADLDSSSFTSGPSGTLVPRTLDCSNQANPNAYCRLMFGGICSFTGTTCVLDTDCPYAPAETCNGSTCGYLLNSTACQPGFVFTGRDDYVFIDAENVPAIDMSHPGFRFGNAAIRTAVLDKGLPRYFGTIVLDVPVGSDGTFTIKLMPPYPYLSSGTQLIDGDNDPIQPLNLHPAYITVACAAGSPCDDRNACTLDICQTGGTCRYHPTYNQASHCCDPVRASTCDKWTGRAGDADGDDKVDLIDIAAMQTCMGMSTFSSSCAAFDLACDCGISLDDHAAFTELLTGP